jgi:hypothetical protein
MPPVFEKDNVMPVPLFDLGKVTVSPAALEALETNPDDLTMLLERHVTGDWPELDGFARTVNEQAIFGGGAYPDQAHAEQRAAAVYLYGIDPARADNDGGDQCSIEKLPSCHGKRAFPGAITRTRRKRRDVAPCAYRNSKRHFSAGLSGAQP